LNFRDAFWDGGFTMKSKVLLCVCIALAFITSSLNAANFQWLGSTSPESLVGENYTAVATNVPSPYTVGTITVGQAVYLDGQTTDYIAGQTEDELFLKNNTVPCIEFTYIRTATIGGHTFPIASNTFLEPLLMSSMNYEFGWYVGTAKAISADGSTVVGVIADSLGDVVTAFRWTESEGMSYLLPIEGSGTYNIANDTSANGSIIVGYYIPMENWNLYPDDMRDAFIWDAANGWQDLNTVVSEQYNIDLGTCRLTDAIGISEDGTQIYGYGLNSSGLQEGFVLTIPEPATFLLLTIGGFMLRRKNKK
jgi:hypothetical protein